MAAEAIVIIRKNLLGNPTAKIVLPAIIKPTMATRDIITAINFNQYSEIFNWPSNFEPINPLQYFPIPEPAISGKGISITP
ncbi:MAG: hypothetical protein U5N58_01520 [Actinomycetota bacterium]|nr:hypothetical protein [Actinomycetota bacterium]